MTRRSTVRPASWRAALVGLAGTVTLTSVLAACGDDTIRSTGDEPTVETSTPVESTATPTETPTETPTPTPTTETPAPTPTETADEPQSTVGARLLPAKSVGGLNDQWTWRDGETRTEEPPAGQLADCVRFSFAAIGALDVATRTYLAPTGADDVESSALQVVAEMGDEQTAVRVMEVLRSWRDSCQSRLNRNSDQPHRVSTAAAVNAGDDAFEYLHTTKGSTPDTTVFEDVAQVRVGKRISLVVVRLDAQDYNYEPAKSPASRSVVAASKRLG